MTSPSASTKQKILKTRPLAFIIPARKTINAPKPATVTINGNLDTNTVQINASGSASDLTIIVTGSLTVGNAAVIRANITAASISDANGAVTFGGSLTSTGGDIALGYQSTVAGNVTVNGSGKITLPQNGTVGGNVTGGGGDLTVSYQTRVSGNVSGTGKIFVNQEAVVSGTVTGTTAPVSVGYMARVTGALQTSTGTIDIGQGATLSACVRSTGAAAITLGYQSSVNSVCCGNGCNTSCVVNNSTYALPPKCSGTVTLDHVEAVPASSRSSRISWRRQTRPRNRSRGPKTSRERMSSRRGIRRPSHLDRRKCRTPIRSREKKRRRNRTMQIRRMNPRERMQAARTSRPMTPKRWKS